MKTYIETNLAGDFIKLSKSSTNALILLICKQNGSFYLCVDYRGLNNLTIKNRYLLLSINKEFDCLRQTKRFTQIDLTNMYHWMQIREDNKKKTAFRSRYRQFEYHVMIFGFSNASVSF